RYRETPSVHFEPAVPSAAVASFPIQNSTAETVGEKRTEYGDTNPPADRHGPAHDSLPAVRRGAADAGLRDARHEPPVRRAADPDLSLQAVQPPVRATAAGGTAAAGRDARGQRQCCPSVGRLKIGES